MGRCFMTCLRKGLIDIPDTNIYVQGIPFYLLGKQLHHWSNGCSIKVKRWGGVHFYWLQYCLTLTNFMIFVML